jgi:hypothetical protein
MLCYVPTLRSFEEDRHYFVEKCPVPADCDGEIDTSPQYDELAVTTPTGSEVDCGI